MARTIIAVENLARSPGSFEIAVRPVTGRPRSGISAGRDAAGAAAKAVSIAIADGGPCIIVGPSDVMAHIPAEFKS